MSSVSSIKFDHASLLANTYRETDVKDHGTRKAYVDNVAEIANAIVRARPDGSNNLDATAQANIETLINEAAHPGEHGLDAKTLLCLAYAHADPTVRKYLTNASLDLCKKLTCAGKTMDLKTSRFSHNDAAVHALSITVTYMAALAPNPPEGINGQGVREALCKAIAQALGPQSDNMGDFLSLNRTVSKHELLAAGGHFGKLAVHPNMMPINSLSLQSTMDQMAGTNGIQVLWLSSGDEIMPVVSEGMPGGHIRIHPVITSSSSQGQTGIVQVLTAQFGEDQIEPITFALPDEASRASRLLQHHVLTALDRSAKNDPHAKVEDLLKTLSEDWSKKSDSDKLPHLNASNSMLLEYLALEPHVASALPTPAPVVPMPSPAKPLADAPVASPPSPNTISPETVLAASRQFMNLKICTQAISMPAPGSRTDPNFDKLLRGVEETALHAGKPVAVWFDDSDQPVSHSTLALAQRAADGTVQWHLPSNGSAADKALQQNLRAQLAGIFNESQVKQYEGAPAETPDACVLDQYLLLEAVNSSVGSGSQPAGLAATITMHQKDTLALYDENREMVRGFARAPLLKAAKQAQPSAKPHFIKDKSPGPVGTPLTRHADFNSMHTASPHADADDLEHNFTLALHPDKSPQRELGAQAKNFLAPAVAFSKVFTELSRETRWKSGSALFKTFANNYTLTSAQKALREVAPEGAEAAIKAQLKLQKDFLENCQRAAKAGNQEELIELCKKFQSSNRNTVDSIDSAQVALKTLISFDASELGDPVAKSPFSVADRRHAQAACDALDNYRICIVGTEGTVNSNSHLLSLAVEAIKNPDSAMALFP